jgi:nucleotide-binding universal stress UspA family protein
MTKNVLCTTDFSEASKRALEWAINFSKEEGSDLTILFTYRLTKNVADELVSWKKNVEEEAKKKFVAFESQYLKDKGIKYEFKVEVGFVADRIEDHAKNNPLGFLVIDRTMCTRNKETFDDLIESINVPVVIIPY